MAIRLTVSKNRKRLVKQIVPEPDYVWLPLPLLAQGDSIVVAQQEVLVQALSQQQGMWMLRVFNAATRTKAEEFYLPHQFVYAKATDAVRGRLKQESGGRKQ